MKFTAIKKRSIVVGRHKTSISLEDEFWGCLQEIARERREHLSELIASIDAERKSNLSSGIRLFILRHYRNKLEELIVLQPAALHLVATVDLLAD